MKIIAYFEVYFKVLKYEKLHKDTKRSIFTGGLKNIPRL